MCAHRLSCFPEEKNAGRQTEAVSPRGPCMCSQCLPTFAALETFVAFIMFLDQ